jgi:signal transduction histidine kinase
MAAFFSKSFKLHECVEQSFFKSILVIGLAGGSVAILMDMLVLKRFDTNFQIQLLIAQVLLVALYGINRIDFSRITTGGILMLAALFTYRGLVTTDFTETTYTLLITIGFISALVSRRRASIFLRTIILVCLLVLLFKDYQTVSFALLLRRAIPYLIVFSIVTVCSGILKARYESNQARLREMVDLLNRKNKKIKDQHVMLKKNYRELAELNGNLEHIIGQKTEKIKEKNKQLADIAYENAHTIRGPLARILGLIHLMNIEPENSELYLCMIRDEANAMDGILLKVTKKIEMNIHK